MPTRNPRINLTLPPDLHDLVCTFAEIQGSRPSTVIRDLLLELQPMMETTVEAMALAKSDQTKALLMLHNGLMEGFGQAAQRSVFPLEDKPSGDG